MSVRAGQARELFTSSTGSSPRPAHRQTEPSGTSVPPQIAETCRRSAVPSKRMKSSAACAQLRAKPNGRDPFAKARPFNLILKEIIEFFPRAREGYCLTT